MCKVDDLIERYDLSSPDPEYGSFDEYLLARWTGADGTESEGYQPLARRFNQRLLKRIYEQHDRETMSVRIESEYEVLTGDDDLQYEEVAADLAADGIDAGTLCNKLVSRSTMRRHLNDCLNGEKDILTSTTNWELDSVNLARQKTEDKVTKALRSFTSKQRLPEADKAQVDIQVKLSCPECPTRVPLEDALERGYVCKEHFQFASPASDGVEPDQAGALALVLTPLFLLLAENITCDVPHLMINMIDALTILFL